MASSNDNLSMAVFCDFENVALGVRDANYEKFDIKPVLERLLLKGNIVVKKAYCDWERYKGFKAGMHEANFELIEIPHVRQSGKNSADIRLVVDALDLCYTKSHVNTFVIISGDSDFSPLVSKLRENAKQVIGVGVKQSTSDLLIANCDEFIFYDDLVRESRRTAAKRDTREVQPRRSPEEEKRRKDEQEARKVEAIDMAVETFDALVSERGDSGKIWASLLKDAIKRRKPDFNESYYGFRTFGNLLEEAQVRGLLEFGRDDKSGAYVYRASGAAARAPVAETALSAAPAAEAAGATSTTGAAEAQDAGATRHDPRRKTRGGRKSGERKGSETGATRMAEAGRSDVDATAATPLAATAESTPAPAGESLAEVVDIGVARASEKPAKASADVLEVNVGQPEARRTGSRTRKPAARKPRAAADGAAPVALVAAPLVVPAPEPVAVPVASPAAPTAEGDVKAAKKPAARSRRPRKTKDSDGA